MLALRAGRCGTLAACLLLVAATATALGSAPRITARSAILVEQSTGQALYGLNANRRVPIASTTKLMTALVTLEHVRLARVFSAPRYYLSPAASQVGLRPGERMSVHDLLLALLLPSADDAAQDLARGVGRGSVARFIAMMNARARQLGLRHTHYSTPIGFDTPANYSTASDLVKLASYELRSEPFFRRAVALRSAVLRTGDHTRVVQNRNDLVGRVPWIDGVKTGHTLGAGYVLVAAARRDGMRLLSAVLGTSSESARDANTLGLLRYGYANFRRTMPIRAGAVLARPAVKDRPGQRTTVVAARSVTRVVLRSAKVMVHVNVPQQLTGPLPRHDVVGTAAVFVGGRRIAQVPLVLARPLAAVSTMSGTARFITRPATVVSILVLFAAAIGLVLRRRDRARTAGEERAEPA